MVQQTIALVRRESLQEFVENLVRSETEIVEDLKRILPYAKSEVIRKSLEGRLTRGEECLKALEEGFVPLDAGYFTRVDVKDKWRRNAVKEVLTSMPAEVKEVWEKVKEKGVFNSFSVTTGGDPILVGNAGGKHFFIASWLCFKPGVSFGIRVKL